MVLVCGTRIERPMHEQFVLEFQAVLSFHVGAESQTWSSRDNAHPTAPEFGILNRLVRGTPY